MFRKKKIIIGIHGLGNKPPKPLLASWWYSSILEGLSIHRIPRYQIDFELVYWTDILHLHPLNPACTDEDDPLFIDNPYTPSTNQLRKKANKLKTKLLDQIDRLMTEVFLNEDMSIKFSEATDKILQKYFGDLDAYYRHKYADQDGREYSAKDRIRQRLEDVLRKNRKKEIFLIGHSMGTIIAYDVMTQKAKDIKINTWVTIGSPLRIKVIRSKIAAEQSSGLHRTEKLRAPENIQHHWYNMSDLRDKIAMDYKLADVYEANSNGISPVDYTVHNDYEFRGEDNPHSCFGYLRTQEMANAIKEFMLYKSPSIGSRIWEKIKRLFQ